LLACLLACLASVACGDDAAQSPSVDGNGLDAAAGDAAAAIDGASAEPNAVDCAPVVQEVLLTCGSIVCHDPFSGGIGTSLDLSQRDALPGSLLGLRSSDNCGGALYIDPDEPEQSLLIRKIGADPPCGDRMPAGDRPPLDPTQHACFVQWVSAAARAGGP
jgi:hypothetical protein